MPLDTNLSVSTDPSYFQRFQNINKKTPENIEAVKKLAEDFESIFMEIVLKSMRETVDKSSLTDGGNGEAVFQSMLDSEYSKSLASQSPSGLASSIQDYLLNLMVSDSSVKSLDKSTGRTLYSKESKKMTIP